MSLFDPNGPRRYSLDQVAVIENLVGKGIDLPYQSALHVLGVLRTEMGLRHHVAELIKRTPNDAELGAAVRSLGPALGGSR